MVHATWVRCLLALKAQRPDLIDQTIMVPGGPGNFDVARNKVAAFFLENSDAEWLLTVDTDMVFSPEHLDALLDRGVKVVSGTYFVDDKPPRPCFGRRDPLGYVKTVMEWDEGELIEVDAVGGGFMLIHRSALLDIGQPDNERGGPWYRQDAIGAAQQVLEPDHAFCQRVQMAGHKVHVDTAVFVGHTKPRILGYE